jgi:hypothetical protein
VTAPARLATMKLITILSALLALAMSSARGEPIEPGDVYVVDGDTINVFHVHPNVRLVGFNAPESSNAACEAEHQLGVRAAQRLRELVHAGLGSISSFHSKWFASEAKALKSLADRIAVSLSWGKDESGVRSGVERVISSGVIWRAVAMAVRVVAGTG